MSNVLFSIFSLLLNVTDNKYRDATDYCSIVTLHAACCLMTSENSLNLYINSYMKYNKSEK